MVKKKKKMGVKYRPKCEKNHPKNKTKEPTNKHIPQHWGGQHKIYMLTFQYKDHLSMNKF